MNGQGAETGFASQLLARGRGEVSVLRPGIEPYFVSDTVEPDVAPALEDPAPPPSRAEEDARPVLAAAPSPSVQPAGQPHAPVETPLMPQPVTVSPPPAPSNEPEHEEPQRPEVAPDFPSFDRETGAEEEALMPPSSRPTPFEPLMPEPAKDAARATDSPTPANPEPPAQADFALQLAQALAKLQVTPETEELLQPRPAADPDPAPLDVPPAAVSPPEEDETSAPLHIHIGEIVVAAESPPAMPQRPKGPAPAGWAPALSLEAYRDQRRKGER